MTEDEFEKIAREWFASARHPKLGRVHDERSDGLAIAHKSAQDVPVPLAGLEDAGGGLGEPRGNRPFGLGRRKRTVEHAGTGSNPQEGPPREPSEVDEIRPDEDAFEPCSAFLVLLRSRVIGVEQEVRIDEDHR
jgi:hypothetical protein